MKQTLMKRVVVGLVAAVLPIAFAQGAASFTLDFSERTGFQSTFDGSIPAPTVGKASGVPGPVPGQGGLEFFSPVTVPPGGPVVPGVPASAWNVVGWGCSGTVFFTGCAPDGITAPSLFNPFPPSPTSINRSALEILGKAGAGPLGINDTAWTDISIIRHNNNVISGNVLRTVVVDEILVLGADGDPAQIVSPASLLLTFNETLNGGACSVVPLPGAPVNPLGTSCDDFFLIDGLDLGSIFIPENTFVGQPTAFFLDFRLDPRLGALVCRGNPLTDPPACGGYSGPTIIVYTGEGDINALAVQGRLVFDERITPEPASLILLGAGLMGGVVATALRKRRR